MSPMYPRPSFAPFAPSFAQIGQAQVPVPSPAPAPAPPSQLPLQDDIAFWGRQMSEHALFLHLLLQDPQLRAEAMRLHQLWQQTMMQNADISRPLSELIAFKQMVLGRLSRGEWLGWALPSFVQHILLEAEYFQRRLAAGTSAGQDLQTWLQIVKDHADVGPKLIDPKANAYADQARPLSEKLGQLQRRCNLRTIEHTCLVEADQAFEQANQWVQGIPAGLNIVHPTLKAHILRENARGAQVAKLLQG